MRSPAKVNLTLEVVGKRKDGYHNIESVMAPVWDVCDYIDIRQTLDSKIKINVKYDTDWVWKRTVPKDETNIVYKVLKYLSEKHGIKKGFSVTINKNIPSEAGLGGGSSNGAHAAKWFAKTFNVELDLVELSKIGADIPFFIIEKTAHVQGIGEIVTPLNSKIKLLVTLIRPPFGSSTKEAYESVEITKPIYTQKVIDAIAQDDVEKVIENMHNSFNILKDVEEKILDAGFTNVVMSGSGSTFIAFGNGNTKPLRKEKYWCRKVSIG